MHDMSFAEGIATAVVNPRSCAQGSLPMDNRRAVKVLLLLVMQFAAALVSVNPSIDVHDESIGSPKASP